MTCAICGAPITEQNPATAMVTATGVSTICWDQLACHNRALRDHETALEVERQVAHAFPEPVGVVIDRFLATKPWEKP